MEANLDDMNPQIYGLLSGKGFGRRRARRLHHTGANEKDRPGTLLTVCASRKITNTLMSLIFAETTTFGARTYRAQRRTLRASL